MRALFKRRTDLPLDKDALSAFLPWLIAFMVYLAALAQSGLIGLDRLGASWDTGFSATLTVQVPYDANLDDAQRTRRVQGVLNRLGTTRGVIRANVIAEGEVLRLLQPWLGGLREGDLPLPVLIDVELDPNAPADVAALSQRLSAEVPGTQVDDHGKWLQRMVDLLRTLEGLAALVLAFILAATAGTIIFTTRTSLVVHQATIEVLHLTGAHDRYIAAQFAWRALVLGLKGGVLGVGLAAPTLLALAWVGGRLEDGMLPDVSLGLGGWASLLALPLASAGLGWLTARATVLRNLRRML